VCAGETFIDGEEDGNEQLVATMLATMMAVAENRG
jgi:hypothetical protein